jgi:ABC-type transport system involved in cytochrome c biogenesis permease component
MISLLRKDLLILRRSRLTVALLVIYPVAIALLIGLALSRGPTKPRVAIVNETTPGARVEVGGRSVDVSEYASQLFDQVEAVPTATRAQAVAKIQSGDVLAAVVIPHDIAARLSSDISQARLEVLYNGDAIEQSLVQSSLNSALAQANLGFSEQIQQAAAQAIGLLLKGGNLGVLGAPGNMIGLSQIPPLLRGVIARQPPGPDRAALERTLAFATFAAQNLTLSKTVLQTISQPIAVHTTLLHGRRTPLNTFAVVVAVIVSEMFIGLLLAAGAVALEREEHALPRLLRGAVGGRGVLVSRNALLAEKSLLAAVCSFVVAFAMLAGIGAFVHLGWTRLPLWLLALALGAVAFAALGVSIGALTREVRAASLLAFLLSLPLAFLALVPSGSVGRGLYDAISAISFVFPFKAALEALDAAVNQSSPALPGPLVHLAALTVLFGALARVGLRRLD